MINVYKFCLILHHSVAYSMHVGYEYHAKPWPEEAIHWLTINACRGIYSRSI